MSDKEAEEVLYRAGKALRPDPSHLRAILTPPVARPVPSPLLVSWYTRTAGVLAVVLVIGSVWITTPGAPVVMDEVQVFSQALEADFEAEAEALALLDEGVLADLEPDVFTDEFLDATL